MALACRLGTGCGEFLLWHDAGAALDSLATAITNMAILLNPRAIVLGGSLAAEPAFLEGLDIRLQRLMLDPPDVVTSSHAPLEGASFEAHRRAREALGS